MKSGILARQINAITAEIQEKMTVERTEYLNAVTAAEDRIINHLNSSTPTISSETSSPPVLISLVNSASNNTVMLEVLKLLKDIKNDSGNRNHYNNNRTSNDNNCRST